MIEVKNLVKRYGNHLAVNNISFTVEKGQVLGLLGLNGAGKSTTMNIITGYISATEGSVTINGHDIFENPELAKKEIGYLPETPPLYMDMTVDEYLRFVAELKKVKKEEVLPQIERIIDTVKLQDVRSRLIKFLSKGYKQRVGIAQALIGNPEVIILDEPTVGLDPKQIIEIRDFIKELSKTHTVILSSHILPEVSAICDHIVIINKGKVVASDSTKNLSNQASSQNSLLIRVKCSKESVQEIISTIPSIERFEFKISEEPQTIDVELHGEKGTDIRQDVFESFSKANCPILLMKSSQMTLEDIFIKLTSDDAILDYDTQDEEVAEVNKKESVKVNEREKDNTDNKTNIKGKSSNRDKSDKKEGDKK